MFLVCFWKKNIYTASFAEELHSQSTWKACYLFIPVEIRKKFFVPEM